VRRCGLRDAYVKFIYRGECEKKLESVTVNGPELVNENAFADYEAVATYTDGTTEIVTNDCDWKENSEFTEMDPVIKNRLVTKEVIENEKIKIRAAYKDDGIIRKGHKFVKILNTGNTPIIEKVNISGPDTLEENTYGMYHASASYSDGTTKDITSQVSWTENSAYTYFDSEIKNKLKVQEVDSDFNITIRATYDSDSQQTCFMAQKNILIKDIPIANELTSLTISGPTTITENSYADFRAFAKFSDGTLRDVSQYASWSEDSPYAYWDNNLPHRLITTQVFSKQIVNINATYTINGITKNAFSSIAISDTTPSYKIIGENITTVGGGTWGPILKLKGYVEGTILHLVVSKIDETPFETTGTVFFKVGTFETYGVDRYITKTTRNVTTSVTYSHDLSNAKYLGTYPKEFYVRFESEDVVGFAYVGPLKVAEIEPINMITKSPKKETIKY